KAPKASAACRTNFVLAKWVVAVLEPAAAGAPALEDDEPELPQPTSETARMVRTAIKVRRDLIGCLLTRGSGRQARGPALCHAPRHGRRGHHGQDRVAVQAARVRVPEQRDLRR